MLIKSPLEQVVPFAVGWLRGGSNESIFPNEYAVGIRNMATNVMTDQVGLSCLHRIQTDAFIQG